jgi:hypothetical protein
VKNKDYPASLELRKLYQVVADPAAATHHQLRVIDESGEDYLYPKEYLVPVQLPAAEKVVLPRGKPHTCKIRSPVSGGVWHTRTEKGTLISEWAFSFRWTREHSRSSLMGQTSAFNLQDCCQKATEPVKVRVN